MTSLKTSGIALSLWMLAFGCGDDDRPSAAEAAPRGPTATTPEAGTTPKAAYVAAARTFAPDGSDTTSYVQVLDAIEPGARLEVEKSIEIPGAIKIMALSDRSWLAIGGADGAPTLTRYAVAEDGRLAPQQQPVSLQPYGVTSLFGDVVYEVASDKLYYPDPASHQLIVIDPQAMAVRGTIALPETVRAGYLAYYGNHALARPGRLAFSVGYFDWTNDKILPETALVVIDTAADRVARVDVDRRCGGISQAVTVPNGDTYYVSSALAGAASAIKRYEGKPCALRIRAGEGSFDPGYAQDLAALTGGAVAGEPAPADGNALFLRVLDASLASTAAAVASFDLTAQPAWRWARWDLGTNQVAPLPSVPPATADAYWFQVDGRVFGTLATADYKSTTLYELTAPGGPRAALTSPGLLSHLLRVR